MAIFDSVLFEGQQADEYKARKEKEAADKKAAEDEREKRRYNMKSTPGGYKYAGDHPGDKHKDYSSWSNIQKDLDRSKKAGNMVLKDTHRRIDNVSTSKDPDYRQKNKEMNTMLDKDYIAKDATNRHLRRHGSKNESVGIFESVELV